MYRINVIRYYYSSIQILWNSNLLSTTNNLKKNQKIKRNYNYIINFLNIIVLCFYVSYVLSNIMLMFSTFILKKKILLLIILYKKNIF